MERIINDTITGFLILSFIAGSVGLTESMMKKAGEAQKTGLMSYSAYTKALTSRPVEKKMREKCKRNHRKCDFTEDKK